MNVMTPDIGMDAGRMRPIHEGDRVRHVTDGVEGTVERIDPLGIPTVAMRLDTGAVLFLAEAFVKRVR